MTKSRHVAVSLAFLVAGAVLVSSAHASPPPTAPKIKEYAASVSDKVDNHVGVQFVLDPNPGVGASFTIVDPDTSGATIFLAADLWPEWVKRLFDLDSVSMSPGEIQYGPSRYKNWNFDQLHRYDKNGGMAGPRLMRPPSTSAPLNLIV